MYYNQYVFQVFAGRVCPDCHCLPHPPSLSFTICCNKVWIAFQYWIVDNWFFISHRGNIADNIIFIKIWSKMFWNILIDFSNSSFNLFNKQINKLLKGAAVGNSDWDEDDWKSGWTERRFYLGKKDRGGNLINDDCDKYDDDNCYDCGDTRSCCNVSIINFENLMFPFSVRWRWSL